MAQIRKNRAEDYLTYFGDMELSDSEKQSRIALAEEIDDVFFFLFALVLLQKDTNTDFDVDSINETTIRRYKDALTRFGYDLNKANNYLNQYVDESVPPIVETTMERLEDDYYTSDDRAKLIAENEANSVKNYVAFKNALKKGMTHKTWVTKRDMFVRHTHILVDGEKIGINDAFEVGDSLMLYPKDIINGELKECANCRCVLKFTKEGGDAPKPNDENTTSIDELHIKTTDDMLHIGSVDNDYLHIGSVDDMLHIKTTDAVGNLKNALEVQDKIDLVENINKGNYEVVNGIHPLAVIESFSDLGYKVDKDKQGNYSVVISNQKTFSYINDNPPYYMMIDENDVVLVGLDGKIIKNP